MGKTTYILHHRGKEFPAIFNNDETAIENLSRIFPIGIRKSLLPNNISVDHIEVDYGEKTLNLGLPLKEQGVKEFDVLKLRDLSQNIRLSVRFKPDKHDESIESVMVKPKEILSKSNSLMDFSGKLSKEYTFYGRKLKKFNLIYNKKKIDLKSSLISQGIKKDIEVLFKPMIWFEWPPRLIWPPPPITTYLIGLFLIAIIGVMVNFYFIHPITDFDVTITCKNCRIYMQNGDFLSEDEYSGHLNAGKFELRLFPKDYPIVDTTLELKPKRRLLPFWDDELSRVDSTFDPGLSYTSLDTISVNIIGLCYYKDKKLPRTNILVNGYKIQSSAQGDTLIVLYRGKYKIQFDISTSRLKEIYYLNNRIVFKNNRANERDIYFDFEDPIFKSEVVDIEFKYQCD